MLARRCRNDRSDRPETNHLDFNGELRRIDHTQEEEHGMRLHVDDVDHMLRASKCGCLLLHF